MTWSERDIAVASDVIARWRINRDGIPVQSVFFTAAEESRCHDNAAAYAAIHGGEVVPGFLVEHPMGADWVYVRAHSVVRQNGALVDPTLDSDQLRGHVFLEHNGALDEFQQNIKRWAEIPYAITASHNNRR